MIPQTNPQQQAIIDANDGKAQTLQRRLEAFRAARPERFPGVERFDVTPECRLNAGEHHRVALWAVVRSAEERHNAQQAAFITLNEHAPEGTNCWLQAGRSLAMNFSDRKGHAMLFGTHADLDAAIESLETNPDRAARAGRGLPETRNPKADWVGIMQRVGNAAAGYGRAD